MQEHQQQLQQQEILSLEEELRLLYNAEANRAWESLNEDQVKELSHILSSPLLHLWLKHEANVAFREILRLDFTRSEDQLKLAARYGGLKGLLFIADRIITQGVKNAT